MGLFKGMKDLKDLSQHHGGMPSIRDSFKDIGKLADDRGEKEVLENGVAGKAVVKGFAEPVPGGSSRCTSRSRSIRRTASRT